VGGCCVVEVFASSDLSQRSNLMQFENEV